MADERGVAGRRLAARPGGNGAAAAFAAARAAYLRGESLDMSALAAEVGVARATLYRWAGNREELLGEVLAWATERTFRAAVHEVADSATGGERLLAVFEAMMRRVLAAEPLRALTQREPRLFVRLATSPGAIESRTESMIAELIAEELAAGRLAPPPLPVPVLTQALVRIADGPLYAHLIGGAAPRIEDTLAVARILLGMAPKTGIDGVRGK